MRLRGSIGALLAQIRFDDSGIGADFRGSALGNQLAEIQHSDLPAQPHDKTHVMLDDQNRQAARFQLDDLFHQLLLFRAIHAGRRFVEQQKLGRGGQRPGDFQAALFAIGKLAGHDSRFVGKTDLG